MDSVTKNTDPFCLAFSKVGTWNPTKDGPQMLVLRLHASSSYSGENRVHTRPGVSWALMLR
jgi:hypothetical protein